MHIDLSNIARAIQPSVILASARRLVKQASDRRPRRERREMNG